jgi:hypothetical protein
VAFVLANFIARSFALERVMEAASNEEINGLTERLATFGWSAIAWECLRRNPRYVRAYRLARRGKVTRRLVCREFGLARIASPRRPADEHSSGRFRPVRVIPGARGDMLSGEFELLQTKLVLRPDQIVVVMSLEHDEHLQLDAVRNRIARLKAKFDRERTSPKPPRNLGSLASMAEIAAQALWAYDRATAGAGPTAIGMELFPTMSHAKAKTKARDIVQRGALYVTRGFARFALAAMQEPVASERAVMEKSAAATRTGEIAVPTQEPGESDRPVDLSRLIYTLVRPGNP